MSASNVNRRRFLATSAVASLAVPAAGIAAPAVQTSNKSGSKTIVGAGDYQYEVQHDWPELPSQYSWQTTHNVAVDKARNLYVIHEGQTKQPDHPSIFIFDHEGKFVRAFGNQYQGGGHGLEIREEGGEEFIYACGYQQVKMFSKMSLKGEKVWEKYAPMESGVYHEEEATKRRKVWGRNRFLPTNFAFLDDGGFLLADGYGSYYIHQFDKDGKWISKFGGPGKGEGKFNLPHGIWIDRRGDESKIVICDRAHHTLQFFTMDFKYIETKADYGLPANIDSYEDLLLVPELKARVTLLDGNNEVVARLGDDPKRPATKKTNRGNRATWEDGRFVHPHDACFGADGEIFVAEWVSTGRISKMTRLG
jgi:hypothetical protein